MIRRRGFLAAAGALAAPRIGLGAEGRVLRFIPQSDLAVLDPIWTAAYVTRNHAMMVFDTLYGTDGSYAVTPQMVAGGNGFCGRTDLEPDTARRTVMA
jgi:peptide/nickel transport system substrate-binding protein